MSERDREFKILYHMDMAEALLEHAGHFGHTAAGSPERVAAAAVHAQLAGLYQNTPRDEAP